MEAGKIVVRPTTVVAEVAAILMRLAVVVEAGIEPDTTMAAARTENDLRQWMEAREALILVTAVIEERRRCRKCDQAASYVKCVGPVCRVCAATARNERLWDEAGGEQ